MGGLFKGPNLIRDGAFSYVAVALMMVVNLVTGVLIARSLGPSGRGQMTAIMNVPALVAWVFAMGAGTAIQYHQAAHPRDAPRLLSTWLVLMLPLGLLAFLSGQLLLHFTFAAQTAATLHLAQLYVAIVFVLVLNEISAGLLLGDQDFLFINLMRFVYPLAVAIAYVSLWALHRFSVPTALLATVCVGIATFVITAARVLKWHGIASPSAGLGATTLWYGVRGHGTTVASTVNERLDLLILPAFLGATQVGIYAVATKCLMAGSHLLKCAKHHRDVGGCQAAGQRLSDGDLLHARNHAGGVWVGGNRRHIGGLRTPTRVWRRLRGKCPTPSTLAAWHGSLCRGLDSRVRPLCREPAVHRGDHSHVRSSSHATGLVAVPENRRCIGCSNCFERLLRGRVRGLRHPLRQSVSTRTGRVHADGRGTVAGSSLCSEGKDQGWKGSVAFHTLALSEVNSLPLFVCDP